MNRYTRPPGVMGGPCSHCGVSQPEHHGLTCEEAQAKRAEKFSAATARSDREATMNTIRGYLEVMIHSAEVYVDGEQIVTGYKIKTGALHKLIGFVGGVNVPVNLPVVGSRDNGTTEPR